MHTSGRKIQERLGSALQALAQAEQMAGGEPVGRAGHRLLKLLRQVATDLDVAFRSLQEASTQQAALRREVDGVSQRAELLFALSPLPYIVVRRDGVIEHANAAAAAALNTSLRHLQRRPLHLFLGGDRDVFLAWLRRIGDTGRTEGWTARIRPREQRPRDVSLIGAPDPQGHIIVIMTTPEGAAASLAAAVPAESKSAVAPQPISA